MPHKQRQGNLENEDGIAYMVYWPIDGRRIVIANIGSAGIATENLPCISPSFVSAQLVHFVTANDTATLFS